MVPCKADFFIEFENSSEIFKVNVPIFELKFS